MRAALMIVSALTLFAGLWACPLMIQIPPESPLYQLKGELDLLPVDNAEIDKLQLLLDDGIRRTGAARKRLAERQTILFTSLVLLGGAGLIFALGNPKIFHDHSKRSDNSAP